ncbi:MAG: hypothetical protein R3C01_09375 [Planctomycetaceae bacterium]
MAVDESFLWSVQPQAASLVGELVQQFRQNCPAIEQMAQRLTSETGTRLIDWVDHLAFPNNEPLARQLADVGYSSEESPDASIWQHSDGLFPPIRFFARDAKRLVMKVDSIADFVAAHGLHPGDEIDGLPLSPIRRARIAHNGETELWGIERHGARAFVPLPADAKLQSLVLMHGETLRLRRRSYADDREGFSLLETLLRRAIRDLGTARTCDLFFRCERLYWQSRNQAARVQKERQDRLGIGWGNHDHHTYRSSREHFSALMKVFRSLGFEFRERFYAGHEAGWGAQVLEHAQSGVVIFADVDLAPEEVSGDFTTQPLPPRPELGTVGLWCKLHGESILQAGMHHLECQFDFDAARSQLAACGIETMKPFTDFPHLRQAFTRGERWVVAEDRLQSALSAGAISTEQADRFRTEGAVGSHLEILERNDGFKGFNQTGINEIIQATDPRGSAT